MSATGNPRNKVALKPGHSLMDWIRLGNSGNDLTGVGGAFLDVTKEQLEKHNKTNDAWLCIRGKVYNVTKYMDFHPGGQEELMRGVGTDATALFNQVHAWVNYESILQKCVIGRLRPVCDENPFNIPSSSAIKKSPNSDKGTIKQENNDNKQIQMDWFQQLDFVTLVFYTKTTCPQVHVSLREDNLLHVQLNRKMQQFTFESPVSWPAIVSVGAAGKVQIKLNKEQSGLWKSLGKAHYTQDSIPEYWTTTLKSIVSLTHDTKQIDLVYQDNVFNYIPVAHHIFIRRSESGDEVLRPYTPVTSFASKLPSNCVRLIVKGYSNGSVSPWLCSLHPGDYVHISSPYGSFDIITLGSSTNLVLLAAGTGITPMISLITWALTSSRYLATGISFSALHHQFLIGTATISIIVKDVCNVICKRLSGKELPEPTCEQRLKISEEFFHLSNFPNCIGAIDGKHIRIKTPYNSGSLYYNYKHYSSIVLLALADANYCFTSIDVGAYGREGDCDIFNRSILGQRLRNNQLKLPEDKPLLNTNNPVPFIIVGVEAFGLGEHLMRPYPRRNLTDSRKVFNYRLTRARRFVECAFGILSNKWAILHTAMSVQPKFAEVITKTVCVLHNFVRRRDGYNFSDTLSCDLESVTVCNLGHTMKSLEIRKHFEEYFTSPQGAIEWQYRVI